MTLIRAILLKPYQVVVPKTFGHSTRFSMGGNSSSAKITEVDDSLWSRRAVVRRRA